ncbi:MAG: tRNA (adenosine(37)-N6)-threonylcarbamoyltransferase complex transferase subunit TsaD [Desulfarculaceae bacterium]|nr:tRNA (adenosine(37)-N6)-threonylcarbamoyltransferase complex transferase subunit TsaD [Desulfarculaceae bacterium]MCF8073526.1 tRNA (adenosine(37)-N6)-threonylcarbamoyltransferase complex transferase subunit TsaD [Desulfarculaceae bacterium]MCF8103048.1 tRNA (adenosine(37)-N6)-threonylcarbamoyltransferase complex transferase subunit TsaD [Desulfarculaceae bacterium]MCF8115758.1 tRNA (adenosine(37)-N6)-threonylcarbamoyltransferase complex transferase subunit TsaD [Desulfarculaceae bacterium]
MENAANNSDPGRLVLGIESSCDESAAAVVAEGRRVLSSVVASQVKDHAPFGGVVPELASRRHLENLAPVVKAALSEAGVTLDDLSGVAVTQGPGLIGALLIGLNLAKALAWSRGLPMTGVSHLEGHLAALSLGEEPPPHPFLALLVSGGHTSIFLVRGPGEQEELGSTVDDAAGEAFDKVAKLYGLGYPGGVIIDRMAAQGDPTAIVLPRPRMHDGTLDFSFSGLKSAVVRFREANQGADYRIEDLCAGFQEAVVEVLVKKTLAAAKQHGITHLALAGGVAANRRLRAALQDAAGQAGLGATLPPLELCTDNAAMIAAAGCHHLRAGRRLPLTADAISRLPRGGALPPEPAP